MTPDEGRPAPLGVYLHVPFCSMRCTYCDFPTVAGRDDRMAAYHDALIREIAALQPAWPREADSVFIGGGTPSRLEPGRIDELLAAVRRRFDLAPDAEVTIEGNPESLDRARLEGYRAVGVRRVSIGVQSLDDAVLRRAGRAHDAARAVAAFEDARRAGFASVSIDLIAGLPGEALEAWGRTVGRIADLEPDHVSVYLIEADKDTPLARAIRSGREPLADDDALARAWDVTSERLERSGFEHYEISNFARPGHRSRHNLKYWTDVPYAAFGLGAHAYDGRIRRANRRDLDGYLADLEEGRDPVASVDPFDPVRRLEEAVFLGLRVAEGIDLAALRRRYGTDPAERWRAVWDRGLDAGLLEVVGTRVRLTRAGRLCSNEVFAAIV